MIKSVQYKTMAKKKVKQTEIVANKELDAMLATAKLPQTFQKGQIIEGKIIESQSGFMLVDVNGRAEGIVAGKELKLEGEKLDKNVGDNVIVYVVKPENDEGLIELSIRRTGVARKWYELKQAKEKDAPIKVKVVEANTGGVLVEIGGGLRGFVPSSQLNNSRIYSSANINYSNKDESIKKLQSKLAELIDEELEVMVMEINREKSKVILSEKLVYSETDIQQRKETLETLKVGDNLSGMVTGIAPFGLFVNAGGLEGLVHLSEISWDKVTNPSDFYKIGDKVEVQVIGLHDNGKKVAYSIKRLKQDPWKELIKKYKVGQIVSGEVKSLADYGAFVKIEDGLNGLIHISELSNKLVKDPSQIVKEGDKIDVMIISISDEDRHLGLSLKRLKSGEKAPTTKKVVAEKTDEPKDSSREMEGLDKILESAEE